MGAALNQGDEQTAKVCAHMGCGRVGRWVLRRGGVVGAALNQGNE